MGKALRTGTWSAAAARRGGALFAIASGRRFFGARVSSRVEMAARLSGLENTHAVELRAFLWMRTPTLRRTRKAAQHCRLPPPSLRKAGTPKPGGELSRVLTWLLLLLLSPAFPLLGATATNASCLLSVTNSPDVQIETNAEAGWSFSASVYGYIVPDSREYVQPTVTADRGLLHLEARYNYENLDTGSLWVGCNFGGGETIMWELTPMLGGVIGDTTGLAPGYKGSIGWWRFELYSEGEYVADTRHSHDSFFYNWSELSLSPLDWFRVGMVTQRTRLYETDRDIQRGVLAGVMFKHLDFTGYILNPDESTPTFVIATSLHF